ncbi:MAG: glycoside hydrolase family 5 protein [Bacteroidetes bacterium]|nr:MAG: glycoside hydrolase family 5 protein [Bacteroidota bacterium]
MKRLHILLALFSFAFLGACKEEVPPGPALNTEPKLNYVQLEYKGSTFNTVISGNTITQDRDLPYGVTSVKVKAISVTENNTVTLKAGDALNVAASPVTITVKNNTSGKEAVYSLELRTRSYASVVEKHGLLHTSGNKIVDKNDVPVSFAGNSFFWSNVGWGGEKYYTAEAVSWLAIDWETTIVRASMGVDDDGGYLDYPEQNKNRVKTLVDAAIDEGVYVIIDWHSHHAEDYQAEAIAFFTEMATLYGSNDHVIYEIYNEPLQISWGGTLKPYAEAVITAIRAVDPDNMIIVGTPEWSQQVDKPAADPITISDNIAYTLHFYTKYHQQWLRDRATAALNSGIALFITEWGSIGYTQNDPETDKWIEWCRTNKISHCNWAVNDKAEEWSILRAGASPTGGWSELTEAGLLTKKIVRGWEK